MPDLLSTDGGTRQFGMDGLGGLKVAEDLRQRFGREALELHTLAGIDLPFQAQSSLLVVGDVVFDIGPS
jgi:hypothetical protein